MPQDIKAQKFFNVMRQCFADDKDRLATEHDTLKCLQAGSLETDALLSLKDAQVLGRTCREMRQLIPSTNIGDAIQAATRLKKISRLPVSPATMALKAFELNDSYLYKKRGSPLALTNVLLALNKSKFILTKDRYDYATRGIALAWFAYIADITDTIDGPINIGVGDAVKKYRNLQETRRFGAHYLVKRNFTEGAWLAASFATLSAASFSASYAMFPAAKMTGYKFFAAKLVFGASALSGALTGAVATAAVYGASRNIYLAMTASPDVWLSDWYRDAFLFYMLSRHNSFDRIDADIPNEDLFGDGWHLGLYMDQPLRRTFIDVMCLLKPHEANTIKANYTIYG